jgi:hypothetical protein
LWLNISRKEYRPPPALSINHWLPLALFVEMISFGQGVLKHDEILIHDFGRTKFQPRGFPPGVTRLHLKPIKPAFRNEPFTPPPEP